MQETQVWFLGVEDPLEKEMATHSSILAWKIPWTEDPGRPQSMGSQRVGHDWAISLFTTRVIVDKSLILCILQLLKVEKSHLSPFSSLELALQERTHCPEARSVMIQKPVVIHFFRICPGFQVKITLLFSQTPASSHASQVADISSSQQSPQKVTV